MADLPLGLPRASNQWANQLSHPFEASQRIHPATQNACMFSASEIGKGNPKSQFRGNKYKSGVRIQSKKTQQNIDLTFPASGLLSHFTNSRPWFPFFSIWLSNASVARCVGSRGIWSSAVNHTAAMMTERPNWTWTSLVSHRPPAMAGFVAGEE